jgi:hypothetical protein
MEDTRRIARRNIGQDKPGAARGDRGMAAKAPTDDGFEPMYDHLALSSSGSIGALT